MTTRAVGGVDVDRADGVAELVDRHERDVLVDVDRRLPGSIDVGAHRGDLSRRPMPGPRW